MLTCLVELCDKIRDLSPPRWSDRAPRSGSTANIISAVRTLLNVVSGGDVHGLLLSVTTVDGLLKLWPAMTGALNEISKVYNSMDPHQKQPWLQAMKNSSSQQSLRLKDLHALGFKVKEDMWSSCDSDTRGSPGRPPSIAQPALELLQTHMEQESEPMKNREIRSPTAGSGNITARKMNTSFLTAYQTFPLRDKISYS